MSSISSDNNLEKNPIVDKLRVTIPAKGPKPINLTKNIVGIINKNVVINLELCNYENIKLITLTTCEIKTIKRGLFFSSTDLLTKSLKRIDQLEKLLLIRDIKKSEEKLKEFLLYLSSIIGLKKDKHFYLNLKEFNFTHKIIGNSISSTRVTVTRNLKILEKKVGSNLKKKLF